MQALHRWLAAFPETQTVLQRVADDGNGPDNIERSLARSHLPDTPSTFRQDIQQAYV